jgi:hypothetical protein
MHTRPIIKEPEKQLSGFPARGGGGVKPVLLRVVIDPKAIKIGIMARLSLFFFSRGCNTEARPPPLARPAIWL